MNEVHMTTALKSKVARVFVDYVPEKTTLPAISFTHIADSNTRLLNGNRSGGWDSWRVIVIADNGTDARVVLALLKQLDNTKTADYKNIMIMSEGKIPALPSDSTKSLYIDFKTYRG